jgi:hypothetical protein
MLRCDFRGLPGELQVLQGRYRITTTQERPVLIDPNQWSRFVFPGSKIAMAVVFDELAVTRNLCPKCGCELQNCHNYAESSSGLQYDQWYVQGLRYIA